METRDRKRPTTDPRTTEKVRELIEKGFVLTNRRGCRTCDMCNDNPV